MQTSLITLLAGFIVFAFISYRVGFAKPQQSLTWQSQAGFIVIVFMLIPSVLFVLWQQAGAKKGLAEIGIQPLPELTQSVGIATGTALTGTRVWMFHADVKASDVIGFYRNTETRSSWQLIGEAPAMLVLKRNHQRLTINVNESTSDTVVIYTLQEEAKPDRK
jgi:hypothetical protein